MELYNEYLQLKREREENGKLSKLPVLLPVLISRDKDDSYDYEEEEDENYRGSYRRRVFRRPPPPPRRRIRTVGRYVRKFIRIKRSRKNFY